MISSAAFFFTHCPTAFIESVTLASWPMVIAPPRSHRAALCSSMKDRSRKIPPQRRTPLTKAPSTSDASVPIAAEPCTSSSAFFLHLRDATLPRRHFDATRHETGFDGLSDDLVSLKTRRPDPRPRRWSRTPSDRQRRPRPASPLFSDPVTATPAIIAGLHATPYLAESIRQATPNDAIRRRVKIQSP